MISDRDIDRDHGVRTSEETIKCCIQGVLTISKLEFHSLLIGLCLYVIHDSYEHRKYSEREPLFDLKSQTVGIVD